MALLAKVSRKVYFFRLADHAEFIGKLESAVAYINNLPFNDQGRYQATSGEDTVLAVFVESIEFSIKIQFARIRRDNLPLVEKEGAITPLALEKDAGIMDWSHIVIFGDGIVAAEFNQRCSSIATIGPVPYVQERSALTLSAALYAPLSKKCDRRARRFREHNDTGTRSTY